MAKIGRYYGVERDDILKSRVKEVREARIMLIYIGCEYLKKTVTEMGKVLKITQEAASVARMKGKRIAEDKGMVQKIVE